MSTPRSLFYKSVAVLSLAMPLFAGAFTVEPLPPVRTVSVGRITTVEGFIFRITQIVSSVIPLLFVVALLYFLYGVVQFIRNSGEEKARGEARDQIIAGLIGLFVMVSVWGLVAVLTNTFRLDNNALPNIPSF